MVVSHSYFLLKKVQIKFKNYFLMTCLLLYMVLVIINRRSSASKNAAIAKVLN